MCLGKYTLFAIIKLENKMQLSNKVCLSGVFLVTSAGCI